MPARMYLAAEKDAQCRYAALRHKSTTHTYAGHIIAHHSTATGEEAERNSFLALSG